MKDHVYVTLKNAFLFSISALLVLMSGCDNKIEEGTLTAIIKSVNLVEITGAIIYIDGTICGETSQNGIATISKLEPGQHTIMILAEGYDTYFATITIIPGDQTQTFLLTVHTGSKTGAVMGRVLNAETGQPVAGATVTVDGFPALQTTTDSEGKYRLENVPSGNQTIRATKSGFIDGFTDAWIHDSFDNPVNVVIYP
ncbi:MAG: carboxypeptidase regulatory-like domain-containing protein [Bacteroidales bacterium]|nr:carboxypeptidase regulatory-like domain-containing protein [Bacteroidales bacterium]